MLKKILLAALIVLLALAANLHGCRRVSLVGDSLLGCARDTIVKAINNNDGESWVYKEHIWNGCTAYNNPVNQEIYSIGMASAFSYPDTVVFSFAGNDMSRVAGDVITIESAIQSMQTLMNHAVVAGAQCIVMLESSHRLRGDWDINPRFEMHMDDWFDHWHRRVGDNEFLGTPYTLLIADISEQVEADIDTYIADYIHFTEAGGQLAAAAIVEQINQCPSGRWIFGTNTLQEGASYPPNPYLEIGQ
jgi:hypothetical protein